MAEQTKKPAGDNNAPAGEKAVVKEGNIVEKHFQEKGKQTKENLSSGGKEVLISLTNKVNVEFTKDYGDHIKAGHTQEVSETAFEIYNKAGVVKKL